MTSVCIFLALLFLALPGVSAQSWSLNEIYTTEDCSGPVYVIVATPLSGTCSPVGCTKSSSAVIPSAQAVAIVCASSPPDAPSGYYQQAQFATTDCSDSPSKVIISAVNECIESQKIFCNGDGTIAFVQYDASDTSCSGSSSPVVNNVDACIPAAAGGMFLYDQCPGFDNADLTTVHSTVGGLVVFLLVVIIGAFAFVGYRHKVVGRLAFGTGLPSAFAFALIAVRAIIILFTVVAGILAAEKPYFGWYQYSLPAFVSLANFIVAVYTFVMVLLFAFPKSFPFLKDSIFSYRVFIIIEVLFFVLEAIGGAVIITNIDGYISQYNAACVLTFLAATIMIVPITLITISNRTAGVTSKAAAPAGDN